MSTPQTAPLVGGIGLIERAMSYTLGRLSAVRPEHLDRPTPCASWNLRSLLLHMDDSLRAVQDAADLGCIEVDVPPGDEPDDLVAALRTRGCAIVGAWANAGCGDVDVGDASLSSPVVSAAGAIEIAVHGWDVGQASGENRPLPEALADELLDLAGLLVADEDRPGRFAEPVAVTADAPAAERLLAFLGRPV